jgi:hypothetical protein
VPNVHIKTNSKKSCDVRSNAFLGQLLLGAKMGSSIQFEIKEKGKYILPNIYMPLLCQKKKISPNGKSGIFSRLFSK